MMREQMCATLHIKVAGKSTAGRETAAGSLKSIFVNCVRSVQCTLYNNPVIEKNCSPGVGGGVMVFIGKIGGL